MTTDNRKEDRSNFPEWPVPNPGSLPDFAETGPVPSSPEDFPELAQLIGRLVDEQLTDADHLRLVELLHSDLSARAYYLDYINLHSQLQRNTAPQGLVACGLAEEAESGVMASEPPAPVASTRRSAPSPRRFLPLFWTCPPRLTFRRSRFILLSAVFCFPTRCRPCFWAPRCWPAGCGGFTTINRTEGLPKAGLLPRVYKSPWLPANARRRWAGSRDWSTASGRSGRPSAFGSRH